MKARPAARTLRCHINIVALAVCMLASTVAQAQFNKTEVPSSRNISNLQSATKRSTTNNSQNNQTGFTSPSDSNQVDTSANKGLVYVKETPDSVLRKKVFFFYYKPHSVKIDELWNPTLDPTGAQFSDPLDGFNGNFYLSQGTIGHPHLSVYPNVADGLDFELQYHGKDGYLKTPGNIRFYQTMTPYTMLSYNNSLKKDYLVRVAHTQNIIPGWNVAFDYRLICPEGNLSGSGAKNHYLDATTNYFSRDSRLQVRAGFIWQSMTTDENGGLSDESYFTDNSSTNLSGLPVKLYNSASKDLHHDAFLHATYNFVRQVERLRERDSLALRYDTVSTDSIRLIMDTLVVTDTIHVSSPHVINAGVLSVEMDYSRWKRAAYLTNYSDSILWGDARATLFWTNDAYPDHRWHNPLKLTLGVTAHRLDAIVPRDTASTNDTLVATAIANPFAMAELRLWNATLHGEAKLDNTLQSLNSAIKKPDFLALTQLTIPFDSARSNSLSLSISYQKKMPEVRMLHASGYTLSQLTLQRLEAHLRHSADSGLFRLIDINARALHMNHGLWYDSTLSVVEGTDDLWVYQAALSVQFQWRWFHIDMQQILQHSTDKAQVDVPLLASKNSIYADFSLFHNALRMQIGTDIRYFSTFAPKAYDPATGLFYMQDTEVGDYLWTDVFLNLQIKRASIYLKAGHLNALWESSPRYFLLPHYPGSRFGLFWGITWNFFD